MLVESIGRHLKSTYRSALLPKRQAVDEDEEFEEDEDFENYEEPYRAPAYPYRELGESDVRLLRIVPGTGIIECLLHQMPLTEPRYFYAVSYVWGDLNQKETIMLEGQPFQITKSLYSALHQFRQRPHDIGHPKDYFWIDAVCINQDDPDERSRQVQRMMEIYHAGLVVVWLGPLNEPPADGFLKRIIRRSRSLPPRLSRQEAIRLLFKKSTSMWIDWDPMDDDDNITIHEEFGDAYASVVRAMVWLLSHSWFTRVWTIQESCLDAVPTYYAGRYSIPSHVFFDVFDMIVGQFPHLYLTAGGKRIVSLKLLRHFYFCIGTGRDNDAQKLEMAEVLWELLRCTNQKNSSDPRDQIYGLLGLLRHIKKEELPEELTPNYRLSYEQIYWDYAVFLFQSLGRLDLLGCRGSRLQGVPSWVPDFRYFCLNPQKGRKQPVRVSSDKRILHVQGCVLGTFRDAISGCISAHIMPKAKVIPPGLATRLKEIEETILKPSAHLRGITLEDIFDELTKKATKIITEDGYESFYQVYCRLRQSRGGKRSWRARRKRSTNVRLKEEVIGDQFSSPFLLLADGTISRLERRDAEAEAGDLICIFRGTQDPSLVRPSGESYIFLSQCDVQAGPLKQREFDDDFWADRDIQDFGLV